MKTLLLLLSLLLATNAWGEADLEEMFKSFKAKPECEGDSNTWVLCKHTYKNGDWYYGSWKNGKRNGKGIYIWKSGERYGGDWKDNKKHGEGVHEHFLGIKWIGKFENDKMTYGRWDGPDWAFEPIPDSSKNYTYSISQPLGELCPLQIRAYALMNQDNSGGRTNCYYH